jgi:chorismate synthase
MSTLRYLTAGESHGKGLTVIIEGLPAGLPLTEDDIAVELRRRQGGYGRGRRQKIEQDRGEIRSGVRHGFTLGSPIALFIENKDHVNWLEAMALEEPEAPVDKVTRLRPGHADLPGIVKYGFDDVRPILERASARGSRRCAAQPHNRHRWCRIADRRRAGLGRGRGVTGALR